MRKLPERRTETKISEETYFVNIPQGESDKWKTE